MRRFYSSNPLQNHAKRLVLGSEAQSGSFNCWDVEVGDSMYWTLGVCQRLAAERNSAQPLANHDGFWGLSRTGDWFNVFGDRGTPSWLRRPLKTVRVKMIQRRSDHPYWTLRFLDASDESVIACINEVPIMRDVVPFLIPERRNSPLRIVPVNVNMTTENKFSFLDRNMDMIPLLGIGLFMLLLVLWFLIMISKIKHEILGI